MKRLLAIAVVTLVIMSAAMTTNTYAFTEKQEKGIARQCSEKAQEAAKELRKAIIRWIKAD